MSKKPAFRLGRGLSSLISLEMEPPADGRRLAAVDASPPALTATRAAAPPPGAFVSPPGDGLQHINVAAIQPNPHQPRKQFDEPALAQLAASVKASGLIQPVVVRPTANGFELIAGERRLRAARLAGLAQVPAIIRQSDPAEQAQLALIENVQREDLNPLERAATYRLLLDKLTLTQAELATRLGEERSSIANFLRLLDLPASVQAHVRDRKLSLGHAKLLAGIDDPARQQVLAERAVKEDLSVRRLEQLIADPGATPTPPASKLPPSAHLADLERTITQQLGLRVQLRRAGKARGRLVIHYASLEQFDDLLARLSIRLAE